MAMYSNSPINDKVRKARRAATNMETGIAANETVNRNAKTAGVKLSMAEERKAAKVLQSRMKIDRGKTAARAVNIEKTQEKKAAAKRMNAATGNTTAVTKPTSKPALTKAEKGIAKELSPKGVKANEKMQKNAIDKKYPKLYKK